MRKAPDSKYGNKFPFVEFPNPAGFSGVSRPGFKLCPLDALTLHLAAQFKEEVIHRMIMQSEFAKTKLLTKAVNSLALADDIIAAFLEEPKVSLSSSLHSFFVQQLHQSSQIFSGPKRKQW